MRLVYKSQSLFYIPAVNTWKFEIENTILFILVTEEMKYVGINLTTYKGLYKKNSKMMNKIKNK